MWVILQTKWDLKHSEDDSSQPNCFSWWGLSWLTASGLPHVTMTSGSQENQWEPLCMSVIIQAKWDLKHSEDDCGHTFPGLHWVSWKILGWHRSPCPVIHKPTNENPYECQPQVGFKTHTVKLILAIPSAIPGVPCYRRGWYHVWPYLEKRSDGTKVFPRYPLGVNRGIPLWCGSLDIWSWFINIRLLCWVRYSVNHL